MLNVTFFGVRGSTPCSSEQTKRYGGNTSCVALERPGEPPILFDLGTGLRYFGETVAADRPFQGTAFVTHLHWDHVQGMPFFVPILKPGAHLDLYGPTQFDGTTLREAFDKCVSPPFFPVPIDDLLGEIEFHDCGNEDLKVGSAQIMSRPVPHNGATNGYRVEWGGASVTYISDHQQPVEGGLRVTDEVLELCDGVDLLIHDAQYTPHEFTKKATWGHCTMEFALFVAKEAGARRLALYHHDPTRFDDALDDLTACGRAMADRWGIEVLAAAEGLTVSFDRG